MSDSADTQVRFEANGQSWVMELTNRSIRELQQKLKRPMGKIFKDLEDASIDDLLAIFVVGLKVHHPNIKEDEMIDLVAPAQLTNLVGRLLAATYAVSGSEEVATNPQQPSQ